MRTVLWSIPVLLFAGFVWFELLLGYVALKEMYAGVQRKLAKNTAEEV